MTICNMSIEGGARAGLVGPDDTTLPVSGRVAGLRRKHADWDKALALLATVADRREARFDKKDRYRRQCARAYDYLRNESGYGDSYYSPGSRSGGDA